MLSVRLWRTGPFVRFFAGASLSILGNWFNTVAIAVLAYRLSGVLVRQIVIALGYL